MADIPGTPSEITSLLDALNRVATAADETTNAIKEKQKAEEEHRKVTEEAAEETERLTKAERKLGQEFNKLGSNAKAAGKELVNIATAGLKFATAIGTSATKGVELELKNRAALISQIGKVDTDRLVSMQQIQAAEQSLTDTFISTRAGMEISAEGARRFASDLSGGFKSNFELTGESLKALTVINATTTGQMDAFRQATGRASLSSGQLSTIVNKNVTSFLLFGNKFAKAAADAERAGISLSAIQSAQEGMVSSLDNVIDVTSQLNQLGANVDFGTLVQKLEQEGPDAVLQYLSSAVPGDLFQSTSFRALFNQLGINSEQILRQQQVGSAADKIESQMTQTATSASKTAKGFTLLGKSVEIVGGSFGALALAAGLAALSLTKLAAQGAFGGIGKGLGGLGGGGGAAGATGAARGGAAGATAGGAASTAGGASGLSAMGKMATGAKLGAGLGAVSGLMTGYMEYKQSGSIARALGRGLANFAGSVIGGALGSFIPIPGIGTMLGATAGSFAANWLFDKVFSKQDDMMSGYGKRTLTTPSGVYALNNRDTVIAGTNLFRGDDVMSFAEGALALTNPSAFLGKKVGEALAPNTANKSSANLEKKIDDLISILRSGPKELVINLEGTTKSTGIRVVGVSTTRAER